VGEQWLPALAAGGHCSIRRPHLRRRQAPAPAARGRDAVAGADVDEDLSSVLVGRLDHKAAERTGGGAAGRVGQGVGIRLRGPGRGRVCKWGSPQLARLCAAASSCQRARRADHVRPSSRLSSGGARYQRGPLSGWASVRPGPRTHPGLGVMSSVGVSSTGLPLLRFTLLRRSWCVVRRQRAGRRWGPGKGQGPGRWGSGRAAGRQAARGEAAAWGACMCTCAPAAAARVAGRRRTWMSSGMGPMGMPFFS
jgi:hypothetical protein